MGDKTGIEWTDATWNPTVGCSIVSPGCTNCYAMRQAARLEKMGGRTAEKYAGLTKPSNAGPVWTGTVRLDDAALSQPLRWKRPRRIFVNSMSDLFHEDLPDEAIDKVFAVMALAPQHIFQVLTKRPARMREYVRWRADDHEFALSNAVPSPESGWPISNHEARSRLGGAGVPARDMYRAAPLKWPLPNVWLGTSVERQQEADERIPHLLATPAAARFVSAEPLLGPVNLTDLTRPVKGGEHLFSALDCDIDPHDDEWNGAILDWIIAGGESGPDARPMDPDWARALRDQCQAAGVPFFFKQWGEWLVGEATEQADDDGNPHGLPLAYPDGETFDVISDGHDIVLSAAIDEPAGPKHVWREYWGWRGRLIRRTGKRAAGRLLDGRTWDGMPDHG